MDAILDPWQSLAKQTSSHAEILARGKPRHPVSYPPDTGVRMKRTIDFHSSCELGLGGRGKTLVFQC